MQESANNKKLSEEFDLDAKIAMVTKKLSEEFDLNAMLGMATLKEGSSYYVRGWRCSPKLRRKVDAGLRSFGFGLSYDDVIAYCDNTLFGGGDEGFILTKDAIYNKGVFDPCRVPYSSIDKITSRFAGFTIYLGYQKIDVGCASNDVRDEICMAISLLINIKKFSSVLEKVLFDVFRVGGKIRVKNVSIPSVDPGLPDFSKFSNTSRQEDTCPFGSMNIRILGLGSAGEKALQHMIHSGLGGSEQEDISFIYADTDVQALACSGVGHKIQLGKELTRGLGAGAKPEIGADAAEESLDAIREAIGDADMVFVTAGMGGGTGTGAAPVIAKVAKEKGVLTVGVVTKPFHFEGDKRMKSAMKGIDELRQHVDSLVTIPNDRLLAIAPKNAKLTEMLKKADDVLYAAVRGVTDLLTKPGMVNADFAEVRTVMSKPGMASIGVGVASGENRAIDAAKKAVSNPLLEDIRGAKAILVNITASEDMSMDEFSNAGSFIRDAAKGPDGEDPEIIIAMSVDENSGDEMRITVIATGIEPATSTSQTSGGTKVTRIPPKPQQETAPSPQPVFRAQSPRPMAVPPEVQLQSNPYHGFHDEDRRLALQTACTHAPGVEDFTFEDESDVPTFIRPPRQAN